VSDALTVRDLARDEHAALGQLLIRAYAGLAGFPSPSEQPEYYRMLANIAQFADQPGSRVLVALTPRDELVGGVVYFSDMMAYGSGGTATTVKNASGIRLLGVDPRFRGIGAGRVLTNACIELARQKGHSEVVLHTTQAMQAAWGLYEKLGFQRSPDLDFLQQQLSVFGFRLKLHQPLAENRGS
jgi:ribosomal protein S18 acetylase RimI-like enzyme